MKTVIRTSSIVILSFICSFSIPGTLSAQQGDVSFQVFYDQLSPYGQWANYPNYGYVWIPDVGPDFSPYATNGYWIMTEYGWTWASDYSWGWAPFHYGRWDYDNRFGWFWVPDNEWGPSWVTWRSARGYYGWAPMRPGISINLSFSNDYRDIDRWCFVRERDFGRHNMYRYYMNRRDNEMIIKNSFVINNTFVDNRRNVTYITGPRRDDVQRATRRNIRSVAVRDNERPGETINNNQFNIYRPQVEKSDRSDRRSSPSRITDLKEIRPQAERDTPSRRNAVAPDQNKREEAPQVQPGRRSESRGQQQKKGMDLPTQNTDIQRQDQQKVKGNVLQQKEQQKRAAGKVAGSKRKATQKNATPPPEKEKRKR